MTATATATATATLDALPSGRLPRDGGVAARRAMIRWAWRLFRREWRQQLLIVALVVVAVAATVVGATAATNARQAANFGFGTAQDLATFQGSPTRIASGIAQVQHRFGQVDVIENQPLAIPGSINTYDLRSQNPNGPFGQPMLQLMSGRYPTGPDQVAVTSGVASSFGLRVGDVWRQGGTARDVVGIVENPQSLLDEFALVAPGQVTTPTQVSVLFDAHGADVSNLGSNFESASSAVPSNAFNPETIVLALATVGMLLIALVAVGGFTVLAQRRLRSIGMVGALGATDKNIGLVVRANGLVVGVVGTLLGAVLGLVAWLAYRPHAEASAHHLIGMFAIPWAVVVPAMVLAVVATYFAAARPARSITKVPIVAALSGRPAPPKAVHRSAIPGVLVLVISFLLLSYAGSRNGGGGLFAVVFGLVALIVAVVLLSPLTLPAFARFVRRAPIAVRLAVRDLARYRARSGSALAAITLGVLIAVIICVLAAARYGNVLDYVGPNLASNQLIVYPPNSPNSPSGSGPGKGGAPAAPSSSALQSAATSAQAIASRLGAGSAIELESPDAGLQHAAAGRQFGGAIYVATPQLLRSFGISAASVDPSADVLSMRPGLDSESDMQLVYGQPSGSGIVDLGPNSGPGPGGDGQGGNSFSCPRGSCVANPKIQTMSALPSGTSAPNTVITEHAVHQLGLQASTAGWLIQTAQPLSAAQIKGAQLTAASAGMTVETKNDAPSSSEIINWATVFGIALALGILAMTVGLIRSETASDLRILAATGASSSTRRSLTAATAGALGLLGALFGTVAGYIGTFAFSSSSSLDGLSSLTNVPVRNLLLIIVGMPLIAAAGGWLLAGREPTHISLQPIE
jgi:putative ABC transport system permease protein